MPRLPSEALPSGAETYHLVVQASDSTKTQFVWEIWVKTKRKRVQASSDTFRSLEDAYKAGQDALEYWRGKVVREIARAFLLALARDPSLGTLPDR